MIYDHYGHLVEELAADCGPDKIAGRDDTVDDAFDIIDNFAKYQNEFDDVVVLIGNLAIRRVVVEKGRGTFNLVSLIHPTAIISKSAVIESGCIIESYVVVHRAAVVKESCILNAELLLIMIVYRRSPFSRRLQHGYWSLTLLCAL